jgi:hypothetical protein
MARQDEDKKLMKMVRIAKLSLLAGSWLILVGCGTTVRMYSGPARPANKVAVLQLGPDAGIFSFDDRTFSVEKIKQIEILPGTHVVRAAYFKPPDRQAVVGGKVCLVGGFQSTRALGLQFEAMAGRTYALAGSFQQKASSTEGTVEIRDTLTGQVVASASGPVQSIAAPLEPVRP